MPFPGQLYEAIVKDGAPNADLPGHLIVEIPELYGTGVECPLLIPPAFPGWTAGGWQSVPNSVNPDGGDVRVLVQYLGPSTFRWIGTSQGWSSITDNPGVRAGTRSPDGRHFIYLDNTIGILIQVAPGTSKTGPKSFIKIGTEPIIEMRTSTGGTIQLNANQAVMMSPGGDAFTMDDNGVLLMHRDGVASVSLRSGDVASIAGTSVQISGGTIEMGGGVIPPLHPYLLSLSLLADISLLAADIMAVGLGIPSLLAVPTPNAIALQAKIASSLSAGPPYLSTRITGD